MAKLLLFAGITLAGLGVICVAFRHIIRMASRRRIPAAQSEIANLQHPAFSLNWGIVMAISAATPMCGLWVCLCISYAFHFDQVTQVSCSSGNGFATRNFLPSISACIGDFALQRYIWGLTVACYVQQRMYSTLVVFYTFKHGSIPLTVLRAFVHLTEQFSLVGLTVVSSKENLLIHQVSFGAFWICSLINTGVTTFLNWNETKHMTKSQAMYSRYEQALQWRLVWTSVHILSSCLAIFWYIKHETECASWQYSYFAMSEWTVVISNILFHSGEIFDARDTDVVIFTRPPLERSV